jgi:hypothetical protein
MTTTTERRRLTTDEIALMRAIVMWRREPEYPPAPWPRVDFYERQYHTGMGDHGRSVWFRIPAVDDPADAYGVVDFANARFDPPRSVEVHSLAEAVDVLVAFDFLPARFSSAYRKGWDRLACIRGIDPTLGDQKWNIPTEALPAHPLTY